MKLNSNNKKNLHHLTLGWYRKHQRPFYWRKKKTPYIVLVSEFMLQQTQVTRVEEKLPLFLKRFPSLRTLAKATRAEVLLAWQGMGYNSRAIRLRECARVIVEKYKGSVPQSIEELLILPGIGNYTASAICAFAFEQDVPIIDVNIRRVYSRMFWKMKTTVQLQPEDEILHLAEDIFPRKFSSDWHQAIMDIGSQFCLARSVKCEPCPLNQLCKSAYKLKPEKVQQKKEKLYEGKPLRLWRGKVIEILRNTPNTGFVTDSKLMKELFSKPSDEKRDLLLRVVASLEKDKLVQVKSKKNNSVFLVRLSQE